VDVVLVEVEVDVEVEVVHPVQLPEFGCSSHAWTAPQAISH
jgi:hypothetical protein